MPWHDEPPWRQKHRQLATLDRICRIVDAYRQGDLHYRQALNEIDDITTGTEQIERIGQAPTPEIKTDAS